MPVRVQLLRGVPRCEQCNVPDFLTLLCVTRSALRELQSQEVRMRKVHDRWMDRKEEGPSGNPGAGLLREESLESDWNNNESTQRWLPPWEPPPPPPPLCELLPPPPRELLPPPWGELLPPEERGAAE